MSGPQVFGDVDVVSVKAVLSSEGWGACTHVLFADVGLGQDWDGGLQLVGCDLSDFAAPVNTSVHTSGRGATKSRFFNLPEVGDEVLLLHLTADRPGPRVRLLNPRGRVVARTGPEQHGRIAPNVGVFGSAASPEQYVMIRRPANGRWMVEWPSDSAQPQITGLETAHKATPAKVSAKVLRKSGDRPGRRRLRGEQAAGGHGAEAPTACPGHRAARRPRACAARQTALEARPRLLSGR